MKVPWYMEEPKNPVPTLDKDARIELLHKENAFLLSQIRALESTLLHHYLFSQQKMSVILELLEQLSDALLRKMFLSRECCDRDEQKGMSDLSFDTGVETERTPSPAALLLQPSPYPFDMMVATKQHALTDGKDSQLRMIRSLAQDICCELKTITCLSSELQVASEEQSEQAAPFGRSSSRDMLELSTSCSDSQLQARFMAKLAEAVPARYRERLSMEAWEAARIADEQGEDETATCNVLSSDEPVDSCDEASPRSSSKRHARADGNPNRLDRLRRSSESRTSVDQPSVVSRLQSPQRASPSNLQKNSPRRKLVSGDEADMYQGRRGGRDPRGSSTSAAPVRGREEQEARSCLMLCEKANKREAEDILCEALKLNPNHPAVLLAFADLLAARYGDKRQADILHLRETAMQLQAPPPPSPSEKGNHPLLGGETRVGVKGRGRDG
ncbi:hypothetical protein GUITHDRAFT_114160 [Guillardia theta CCMP2712]|uniref:Uncharacterized protein n=1 Tax=Guillardia theta (strain CCMP2712) TaxID=905079 RepID=L1ITU7_GUITC|nr:hypothetical protein GUITHDRAFT_114160 [Guillardia theta CCMP2712]EKX39663.1 hypothetical protein GUITHDRAFT_114160 [Guillardia theta CCMP2712]|eukprot:XP_005826643.1 hypothetical protein GUITHDRAFT_114160 [Guillardia theta CCMP2712]